MCADNNCYIHLPAVKWELDAICLCAFEQQYRQLLREDLLPAENRGAVHQLASLPF